MSAAVEVEAAAMVVAVTAPAVEAFAVDLLAAWRAQRLAALPAVLLVVPLVEATVPGDPMAFPA